MSKRVQTAIPEKVGIFKPRHERLRKPMATWLALCGLTFGLFNADNFGRLLERSSGSILASGGNVPRRNSWEDTIADKSNSGQHRDVEVGPDLDNDGISDALEQKLAERFAPIVLHDTDEPNLPTNVRLFLPQTELWFYDNRCKPNRAKIVNGPLRTIPRHQQPPCAESETPFDSHGSRSRNKQRSFFLRNVERSARRGSVDSREWTTYFHAYPNDVDGITIQYWRFYAFNTGRFLGFKISLGSHGGDWEAISVLLDANHSPVLVRFLGHRNIASQKWSSLLKEGDHVVIKSENGGHTSRPLKHNDHKKTVEAVRHETWSSGQVSWPAGHRLRTGSAAVSPNGELVNLGEKTAPMPGMEFIQYSGLWGSRESGGLFPNLRSGYWGPAYNETALGNDGFIAAWCHDMASLLRNRVVREARECYAKETRR